MNNTSSQGCSLLHIIKTAACLNGSSPTGKGRSKFTSSSYTSEVSHGFYLKEGPSDHQMEDYLVANYQKKKGRVLGLFAIFDGHMGHKVPKYLTKNLFDNIIQQPNFLEDPETAIRNAYNSTDQSILERVEQLGQGGSTALTVIVIDAIDLWVANIGDSRAVICRGGVAEQLSVDHGPQSERIQIEQRGGIVTNIPGDVPRVNGQLAVARAFGDISLKRCLSSEPDIRNIRIDSSTEFVILASDGIWKVMENQDAVDMVKSIEDPQEAAKYLTEQALARNSKDDISCIVINFRLI